MDDKFVLFSSSVQVLKFHRHIKSRHKNMTFTYEIEENNSLAFLDVLVTREDKFCTSLYRKPTFSGLYCNFESYICLILIRTYLYSSCSPCICSLLRLEQIPLKRFVF